MAWALDYLAGDADRQRLHERDQIVDPRQQRRQEPRGLVVRRIGPSLRHRERDSVHSKALNAAGPSHSAAVG